jgi:hypothetical protein
MTTKGKVILITCGLIRLQMLSAEDRQYAVLTSTNRFILVTDGTSCHIGYDLMSAIITSTNRYLHRNSRQCSGEL